MPDPARILVISPHPDDESIGCGGALRLRAMAGEQIEVIFLTSGENGGHGADRESTRQIREAEARDAARILGLSHVEFWREPDGALKASDRLVRRLSDRIRDYAPSVIFSPHDGEDHDDHRAAALLVRKAVVALTESAAVARAPEVWMYEIWTPISHIDQIVDISESLETKLAAVCAHRSQCAVMRFDEACRGLARYRGEMHLWPGGNYAEAFEQWRPVVKKRVGSSLSEQGVS